MTRLTYQQALVAAIRGEMARDPRVFHMGQDVGATSDGVMNSCKGLAAEFGAGRVIDLPISEAGTVAAGIGAAVAGMRPIVQIMFGEFLSLVMAPLACDAGTIWYRSGGKRSVPMVVRTLFGTGPHRGHPEDFHGWLCSVPGLKVAMPATPRDAKGLMAAAIRDENPVVFFEHMGLYHSVREEVPEEELITPFGVADVKRAGKDITLVAVGLMVQVALRAAAALAKEGIDVEVLDMRTPVPLDKAALVGSVSKTGRLLTLSETWRIGDSMAEAVAVVAEELGGARKIPISRVACAHVPRPFAHNLDKLALPNEAKVIAAAKALLSR
ncbi:MAG TPA: transketolase C-terminal domain-containing protein [Steroidobacteraceae bacterium]|nr:transketolase C-terminal domain-containing protein [Steroidobacteraceae bacterium]